MKYFEVGKIVNTQGTKGDLRVVPTTFDKSRFELLSEIHAFIRNEELLLTIERVWYHKNFVILKFQGFDDMTSAERLKTAVLKIKETEVLPLSENEYYIGDLYDMRVIDENGEYLGILTDILATGANDVYCIKNDSEKELLIPAIKQCILKVDILNSTMTVKLLEGLK